MVGTLQVAAGVDGAAAKDLTGEGKVELGDAILSLYKAAFPTAPLLFHYINDHLNTSRIITDESGQVVWQGEYSPFGKVDVTVNQIDNNTRFPGQYFDSETGLHYNWHRFYDPETGRYISADPIGLAGGINLYAYVENDPVNAVDPDGLRSYTGFAIFGTYNFGGKPFTPVVPPNTPPGDWISEPNGNVWGDHRRQDGVCS